MYDFSDVEPQQSTDLIPDGIFAKVSMTIRPGDDVSAQKGSRPFNETKSDQAIVEKALPAEHRGPREHPDERVDEEGYDREERQQQSQGTVGVCERLRRPSASPSKPKDADHQSDDNRPDKHGQVEAVKLSRMAAW